MVSEESQASSPVSKRDICMKGLTWTPWLIVEVHYLQDSYKFWSYLTERRAVQAIGRRLSRIHTGASWEYLSWTKRADGPSRRPGSRTEPGPTRLSESSSKSADWGLLLLKVVLTDRSTRRKKFYVSGLIPRLQILFDGSTYLARPENGRSE
jgi:hypothetical protein